MAGESTVNTDALKEGLQQYAVERLTAIADAFVEAAQGRCSRRSGALADSIKHDDPSNEGDRVSCVASAGNDEVDYAQYQDEGTGEYGPEGGRIYPVSAKALRFDWPAAGGVVFAKSVAGAPGTHFWSDTVNDWSNIVSSAG